MSPRTRDYDITQRPDRLLIQVAAGHENVMYGEEEPQGRPAAEYAWTEEEFPFDRLRNAPDDWVAWMKEEIEGKAEEGWTDYYGSMFDRPIKEPVIVVEIDGYGYLWDGHHRTGAECMKGNSSIQALVGRPLPEYTLSHGTAPHP